MSDVTQIFSDEIVQELTSNNYTQDRLPGDKLVLPETYYEMKVKVNDFVVSETINYSLNKLYNNWLYLISKSIIPSNNIPNRDHSNYMIVDRKNIGLNWSATLPTTQEFRIQSAATALGGWNRSESIFNNVKQITKVQNVAEPNNYNLIANTSTNIILLSGTGTQSIDLIGNFFNQNNPIYSNSDITHPSNEILFEDIANHVVTQDNDLFVLDRNHKTIFKFDISGILTLDRAILQNDTPGRLMTGMMGGPGDMEDKTRFNNPMMIETVDNLIYTVDHSATESTIKVFDSDLNWKQSSSIGNTLSAGPLHMSYNDQTERFYILCHVGSTAKNQNNINITVSQARQPAEIVVLDKNLQYIETSPLNDDTYSDRINTEHYKKIYFSNENKNIMYVVTDKNIFKKYVSRPERFIGQFLLDEKSVGPGDGRTNFADLTIFPSTRVQDGETLNKDEILLLDGEYRTVFQFYEDSNYERSLQSEFDDKALFFNNMQVQDEEYVSTLTYNKVLTKHMYNNMLLLENTYRKFSTKFNANGISQYIGFKYLNNVELAEINYEAPLDAYVGNNELLLSETINRCLNQILLLQENVLDKMQEKSVNVFPLLTSPVLLTSPYIDEGSIQSSDHDLDGIPDTLDPDDDNDGIPDSDDVTLNVFDFSTGADSYSADEDGDNLSDYQEYIRGTDPGIKDTDGDGVDDDLDLYPLNAQVGGDRDEDGNPDITDIDDDNDGFMDYDAALAAGVNPDALLGGVDLDLGPSESTGEIVSAGNPGGTMWKRVDGVDTDGDGIDDVVDIDIDGDHYLNYRYDLTYVIKSNGERTLKSANPTVARQLINLVAAAEGATGDNIYYVRTDESGIPLTEDGQFIAITESDSTFDYLSSRATGVDTDQDNIDDVIDEDDDNDGLLDVTEIEGWVTSLLFDDEGNQRRVYSDSLVIDTDLDTLTDKQEYDKGTDPSDIDSDDDMNLYTRDDENNIVTVGLSGRDDSDAFPGDPAGYRDTDSDGKPDEFTHTGVDYSGETPALTGRVISTSQTPLEEDLDDDDDLLSDEDELAFGSDPKLEDTDGDGLDDKQEFDADTNPREARAHLAETLVYNGAAAVLSQMTREETFSGTLSSLAELNNLFLNSGYLSSTPYTFADVSNETNSNEMFTLNTIQGVSGIELANPVDFDTGNTSLTAMFQAHDQSSNVIPGDDQAFVIHLEITDVVEDTDSDGIIDPEDDTPSVAALQFKSSVLASALDVTTDSNNVVTRVKLLHNIKAQAIEENGAAVVLNANLDNLFVNPAYRGTGAYQLIGSQSIQAGEITGSELKLKTFDYETLFNTPNGQETRALQIKTRVTDTGGNQIEIWYQVWVKNTDDEDTDQDDILDFEDLTKSSAQLQLSSGAPGTIVGNNMTINWPVSVYENMLTNTNLLPVTGLVDNPDWFRDDLPYQLVQGEGLYDIVSDNSMVRLLSAIDFETLPGTDVESRYATAVIEASGQELPAVVQTITFNVSVTNQTLDNTGLWDEGDVTWETVDTTWHDLSGI